MGKFNLMSMTHSRIKRAADPTPLPNPPKVMLFLQLGFIVSNSDFNILDILYKTGTQRWTGWMPHQQMKRRGPSWRRWSKLRFPRTLFKANLPRREKPQLGRRQRPLPRPLKKSRRMLLVRPLRGRTRLTTPCVFLNIGRRELHKRAVFPAPKANLLPKIRVRVLLRGRARPRPNHMRRFKNAESVHTAMMRCSPRYVIRTSSLASIGPHTTWWVNGTWSTWTPFRWLRGRGRRGSLPLM